MSADASVRLTVLAKSRPLHAKYRPEASIYTRVNSAARNASATSHLKQLAKPKPHKVWATSQDMYREGDFSKPIWSIETPALSANCSTRVEVLADHKQLHLSYQPERQVQWPVTDTAKNAVASLRMQQLARPKSGRLVVDDYDPYKLSPAAKNTRATPRIVELSMPLPRKMRHGVK